MNSVYFFFFFFFVNCMLSVCTLCIVYLSIYTSFDHTTIFLLLLTYSVLSIRARTARMARTAVSGICSAPLHPVCRNYSLPILVFNCFGVIYLLSSSPPTLLHPVPNSPIFLHLGWKLQIFSVLFFSFFLIFFNKRFHLLVFANPYERLYCPAKLGNHKLWKLPLGGDPSLKEGRLPCKLEQMREARAIERHGTRPLLVRLQ